MSSDNFKKNAPNWVPTVNDYVLIFREVDGCWREITGNLAEYRDMILADYYEAMDITLPDGCTFCRIRRSNGEWEIRDRHSYVKILFKRL